MGKTRVAVVGSGNIGTDLVVKLRRSETLQPVALVGIDPASDGLRHARSWGLDHSRSSRHRRQMANENVRSARAEAISPAAEKNPRVASSANGAAAPASARPAPSKAPPVQTLE